MTKEENTCVLLQTRKKNDQSHLLVSRLLVSHAGGARQARRRGARGARGRDELVVGHRRRLTAVGEKEEESASSFLLSDVSAFSRVLLERGQEREPEVPRE